MPYLLRLGQVRFRRTTKIQIFLLTFLLGLWWAAHWPTISATILLLGIVSGPLVFTKKLPAIVAALLLGLSLGFIRGQQEISATNVYEKLVGQSVIIEGVVEDDPVYNRFFQREFHIGQVVFEENKLPGRVEVSGFGITSLQRGDRVQVRGTIKSGYGSDNADISFAQVDVLARTDSPINSVRKNFFAGTYSSLPEPESSLGLGFLVGGRTLLPDDLLSALSVTGLTHIVAVSGYNLTILVRLMRRSLAKFSKYWAVSGSFALIISFIAITGISPSIARAGVVTSLALLAWYWGRKVSPTMLLLLSGAITAGLNPQFLWSDLGWWLSFLAFIGVLILAPLVTKRLYGDKKPNTIMQIVLETSCAQLLTMPLIGAIFGEFSLIAILANAIILPLIPLAMLLTFIAGLSGWLITPLAGWFAWPARFILELITSLVTLLAQIPYALVTINLSTVGMIGVYASILGVILILYKKSGSQLNASEVIE
ncbi:TPA: ComEC family competence protein [Candidatus Saccharibacteria bacterium]|nr:ComEC family competence protein [Candidatus Saccharibacteria bacterium]HIO87966.1 ComEC family competence protein [Candidatus Saccharibacteria bacterium]